MSRVVCCQPVPDERRTRNHKYWSGKTCGLPCLGDSMYCATHRAEAMARVELVRDDRPKAWPGLKWNPARDWADGRVRTL